MKNRENRKVKHDIKYRKREEYKNLKNLENGSAKQL